MSLRLPNLSRQKRFFNMLKDRPEVARKKRKTARHKRFATKLWREIDAPQQGFKPLICAQAGSRLSAA
jgi:hypothetical protein